MEAPISLPRFFKVVHDQEQKEEIRIPKVIANKYWKGISNPIFLRVPNGDEWKIFWEKRDDDIWLHKNWKKFAELYSLKFGSFLVFKYKGKSSFKVSIFESNMVEIKYPCKIHDDSEGRYHDEEVEEHSDSVEECEIIIPPLKKKKENSNGEPKNAPSERTNNNGKRKIDVDFDDTQQEVSGGNRGGMVNAKNCSKAEKIKEISRNFDSENPFCVVMLSPSYLQQNLLLIPSEFSRNHMYGLEGNATFVVGEDLTSTWTVSFTFEEAKERTRLGSGWKSFCQYNHLQVGDACIFEMIKRDPITFKIHFRPGSDLLQVDRHEGNKNKSKGGGAVENMECFGNSRSCPKKRVRNYADFGSPNIERDKFEITVNKHYPNIPREFMKRHSRCHGNYVKLKVEERSWDVKVLNYEEHTRLCVGWSAFKRGCGLNNGDICVFEMVDEEKHEFKVSIRRSQD